MTDRYASSGRTPGALTSRVELRAAELLQAVDDQRAARDLRWYQVAQELGCAQEFRPWAEGRRPIPLNVALAMLVWLGERDLGKYVRIRPP